MNPTTQVPSHENWPCFVGSGECQTQAEFVIDDGNGGNAYICPKHYKEFMKLEEMLEGNPQLQEKLKEAIDKYE